MCVCDWPMFASLYCLVALHQHPPAPQAASTGPWAQPVATRHTASKSNRWRASSNLSSQCWFAGASSLVHPATSPNRRASCTLRATRNRTNLHAIDLCRATDAWPRPTYPCPVPLPQRGLSAGGHAPAAFNLGQPAPGRCRRDPGTSPWLPAAPTPPAAQRERDGLSSQQGGAAGAQVQRVDLWRRGT